jgi:hypothetical protein
MSKNSSIHPGEIFLTEFMKPLGVTGSQRIITSSRSPVCEASLPECTRSIEATFECIRQSNRIC